MWDIQLFKLNFDQHEMKAVKNVISSEWLTMGEKTIEFEEKFAKYISNDVLCSAVSSCTAALHLSLLGLDIGLGDEVIVPGLTFVASANVVKLVGAKPILSDCESLENWNMTAEKIEKCITDKTKAVIIVHYAGYPCDIKPIVDLCKERNIYLIEDVAHAPGASIDGIKCGAWGDIGTFSFFSNKNLSVGEGGMITSRDAKIHNRLKSLRSHGMTSLTLDRHKGRSSTYNVTESGLNYRLDEIRSALGIEQLKKLDHGNKKRMELTKTYRLNLDDINIEIPYKKISKTAISAYHILPVLLPKGTDRENVMNYLKENKIQSSIHYPAFWDFEAFRDDCNRKDAPYVAEICDRQLTLPLYPTMTHEEVSKVTDCLKKAI